MTFHCASKPPQNRALSHQMDEIWDKSGKNICTSLPLKSYFTAVLKQCTCVSLKSFDPFLSKWASGADQCSTYWMLSVVRLVVLDFFPSFFVAPNLDDAVSSSSLGRMTVHMSSNKTIWGSHLQPIVDFWCHLLQRKLLLSWEQEWLRRLAGNVTLAVFVDTNVLYCLEGFFFWRKLICFRFCLCPTGNTQLISLMDGVLLHD